MFSIFQSEFYFVPKQSHISCILNGNINFKELSDDVFLVLQISQQSFQTKIKHWSPMYLTNTLKMSNLKAFLQISIRMYIYLTIFIVAFFILYFLSHTVQFR